MTRLATKANGISRTNNPAVFGYLKKLNDRGEISAVLMKLIMDSFWGIEMPVISRRRVSEISAKDFSPAEVYERIGATDNKELFLSVAAIKTLVRAQELDVNQDVVKKYHAAVVRLFL